MNDVVLAASTGDENVDALLREVISRVEQALPARIRGYYVVGSHAYGGALPVSDIDLDIVVKGGLNDEATQGVETVSSWRAFSSTGKIYATTFLWYPAGNGRANSCTACIS